MDPLDILIASEDRDLMTGSVRAAVSHLPETERLVTRMAYFEGFDENDIGACLAMRPSKVRRALERAREMLKARLA